MANNYTAGTIETNFNEAQSEYFLHAYRAYIFNEVMGDESGCSILDVKTEDIEDEVGDCLEQNGNCFWDLENLDVEAVKFATYTTFDKFPLYDLKVELGFACYCSKPRMGEFSGGTETFSQSDYENA